MSHPAKITTCSYCGQRAAISIDARSHHDLSCGSCGGPVTVGRSAAPGAHGCELQTREVLLQNSQKRAEKKSKKKQKRKSTFRWLVGEAIDVIEDIFD